MSDADPHQMSSSPRPSTETSGFREREIFLTALELPIGSVRDSYLNEACNGDESLKGAVQRLLKYHQEDDFLETSVMDTGTIQEIIGRGAVGADLAAGQVIGRYRLVERVGEGGCGSVFLAEQEEPIRRRVALKVIKLGMDTASVVSRFEGERQTLAIMDHPHIAQVYDAGATELGRPYFVMELVSGERITQFSNRNRLTIEARLRLFLQVCQAIQHAHQKGVIHRDIKPSNILVMWKDSVPHLKVIDFGIAKAIDPELKEETFLTELNTFFGTPAYMSPEQAMMGRVDIDTRSDIYSLGVLIY